MNVNKNIILKKRVMEVHMNTEYKEILRVLREYVDKHRIELFLIVIAALVGSMISYHLWRIDFW